MKRTASSVVLCTAIVAVMTLCAIAAESTPAKAAAAKSAPAHPASSAVLVASTDLKWSDVPDFPGVKVAAIQGDPNKGPSHFFMKLPAGFSAPLHFHDADHWTAVVSGTLILTPEGGAEKQLPAGSGFGFTGKKRHTTRCAEGADCVLFVDSRGKWDVVPVEKKK